MNDYEHGDPAFYLTPHRKLHRRLELSEREEEVARLVALGYTNKEVGRRLGVTEHTVKNHITHIVVKWRCLGRAAIGAEAVRRGLIV
jgi:DNA-binding CsgD family transcriptional regulator